MNKKKLAVLIGIVVLLGGMYFFFEKQGEKAMENQQGKVTSTEETKGKSDTKDPLDEAVDQYKKEHESETASDEPAPDFTLLDLDGNEISLSDYKGKPVLINFWATWCQFCDLEMPDLQKFSDEYGDEITVLGVNVMETNKKVSKYIEEGGYNFKILLDEKGDVSREYLAAALPASYFVDSKGTLIGMVPGLMTYDQMKEALEIIKDYEKGIPLETN